MTRKESAHKWYLENKDRWKVYNKRARLKRKDKTKISNKKYRETHKEYYQQWWKQNSGVWKKYYYGKLELQRKRRREYGYRKSRERGQLLWKDFRGKNHFNWKGGISPLVDLIKHCQEAKTWRKRIYQRDNYTCQECRRKESDTISPHHKKRFSFILAEFLQEYNQFSPIEDKETLLRLATKYQPFWDVDNGITYCKDCHNEKHYANRPLE